MAHSILLESRSFRPFKSSEEYLYAMKEDLAEWLNTLYPHLSVNVDNFMETLETGVVLCEHANNVRRQATEYLTRKQLKKSMSCSALTVSILSRTAVPIVEMGDITFRSGAKPETFFARDNVSNFIDFARKGLEILECLLFETEDLIGRKNEKNVILCLLEVARKGAKYGMLAPILIQMEKEIDREIAADRGETAEESSDDDDDELSNMRRGPIPQIVTNDLKSLDEMVRDLLEQCHCPTQFPMIRVSEGKYRIGDTKMLIFVRILRNHVMVRVGGGWDTLSHYLDKHDPCRCKTVHRAAVGSKIVQKSHQPYEAMDDAFVHYDRTRRSSASSSSSGQGGREATDIGPRGRSRSPTPNKSNLHTPKYSYVSTYNFPGRQRSASPNPQFLTSHPSRSPAPSRRRSHDMSSTSSRRTPSPRRSRGNENLISPSPQRRQLNISNPRRSPSASRRSSDEPISSPGPRRKLTPRDPRQGRSRSPGKHLTVTSYDQPTASSRNRSRSPSVQPLKESSNYRSPDDVSDDGYLSVGYEEKRRRESQTTDCSEREGDIEKPLLKNGSINGSRTEMNESRETSREPSVSSRCSPERSRQFSTDSPYRRGSMTRSRSASSDSSVFDGPRRLSGDKCGTWNGKLKGKRTMVSCENFQRGGLGRSSLGAKTEYDPKTGRRLTPVSPLVSDLLQVKNLDDDKVILQKMKELISQYSDLLEKNEEPGEKGICRRKDSKHKSGITKIPAPVFYKQPSTEKEF